MLKAELVNFMCTTYEHLTVGYLTGSLAYYYYIYRLEKTPITGRKRSIILSENMTEKLSRFVYNQATESLAESIVPPRDPQSQRVTTLLSRLLDANKDLPEILTKNWTVTLLNDDSYKVALILPNGNIFITTSYIQLCSSDDELAINLGHEIAHTVLGHGRESLNIKFLLGAVKVLSMGLFPVHWTSVIPYLFSCSMLNVLFYYPQSWIREREADKIGLQIAAKACFDVRSAVAFWGKLAQTDGINEPLTLFYASHPSHRDRQEELEKQLPSIIRIRKECGCPELPSIDPRGKIFEKLDNMPNQK